MSIHTPHTMRHTSNYPFQIAKAIGEHSIAHPENNPACAACEARSDYWISCAVWKGTPGPKKGWREVLRRVGIVGRVRSEGDRLVALNKEANR